MSRISAVSLRPLCVFGLALLAGCSPVSDTPPTAPVEGTVTYQGKPVESGTVTFFSEGGERPAAGLLGPGGKFTLTTFNKNDGAVLGTHKVTVTSIADTADVGTGAPTESLVPEKYNIPDTTPLSYEVKEGGNQFEITLED
ncbi:MAG: hypothetical protein ABIK89_11715 [Planctomycetota bacterium]